MIDSLRRFGRRVRWRLRLPEMLALLGRAAGWLSRLLQRRADRLLAVAERWSFPAIAPVTPRAAMRGPGNRLPGRAAAEYRGGERGLHRRLASRGEPGDRLDPR